MRSRKNEVTHDMVRESRDGDFVFTCSKAVIQQCALHPRETPGCQSSAAKLKEDTNASAARSQLHGSVIQSSFAQANSNATRDSASARSECAHEVASEEAQELLT